MDKWNGKTAVVTGGSSGIGESIISELLAHGMTVINLDKNIDESKVVEVNRKLNSDRKSTKLYAKQCDVADIQSLKEAFKWIEDKVSVINVHVNSAGLGHNVSILDYGDEATAKINQTINVNFTGTVHATREAVRLMKKSDDHAVIVNISSILGHYSPFGSPFNVYGPTKHAIRAFSEITRQELIIAGWSKIKVSNLSPSNVKTSIRATAGFPNVEEFYKKLPHLDAKDVADAVMYVLSTPYKINISEVIIRPIGDKF